MSEYRRAYVKGGTFFFTLVTHERQEILCTPTARTVLREAFVAEQGYRPFEVAAIVLLPDHLHCIWTLPGNDSNFSTRWNQIKKRFTAQWLSRGGREGTPHAGKSRKRERGVWQRRFWEHRIRSEDDWKKHADYIHYNPVKHGYVTSAGDWEWSSLHSHIRQGLYEGGWGDVSPKTIFGMDYE